MTSGAFPLAGFLNCHFQKEDPKWCAPITAAEMLDKAVMDVNRQVSAASTAPLERDESLRVQVSGLTSGAFPLARFLSCQFHKEIPKW